MNFELNPIIISVLLSHGFYYLNAEYLIYLFTYIKENGIQVNRHVLDKMEKNMTRVKRNIIEMVILILLLLNETFR